MGCGSSTNSVSNAATNGHLQKNTQVTIKEPVVGQSTAKKERVKLQIQVSESGNFSEILIGR